MTQETLKTYSHLGALGPRRSVSVKDLASGLGSAETSGAIFNCVLADTHEQALIYIQDYAARYRESTKAQIAEKKDLIAHLAQQAVRDVLLGGEVPESCSDMNAILNSEGLQSAFAQRLKQSAIPTTQHTDAQEVFVSIMKEVVERAEARCNNPIVIG